VRLSARLSLYGAALRLFRAGSGDVASLEPKVAAAEDFRPFRACKSLL